MGHSAQDNVEYFVVCLHVHIIALCSRRCIHRMAIKLRVKSFCFCNIQLLKRTGSLALTRLWVWSESQDLLFHVLRGKLCPCRHFTILFTLFCITVAFSTIFVPFVNISFVSHHCLQGHVPCQNTLGCI